MVDAVGKGPVDEPASEPIRVQVPGQASTQLLSATGDAAADAKGQVSWALFEWARNPYVILITIYIFSPYFTSTVVGDPVRGQAIWGNINGIAGFFIACLGPVLGAIADTGGKRKPWIVFFIALMVPAMFALWWAMPGEGGLSILSIAALIVLVAVAFEFSAVFHNSMLPAVAPHERIGFLSGLGLALGNAGALLILCFMLWAFMLPGAVDWGFVPDVPLFGIDALAHENSRISGPIVAVWLLVFSLPLLLWTPDVKGTNVPVKVAIRRGLGSVVGTVRKLRHYRNIAIYLGARMFYNDGKTAVLVFGGVYAVGVFGWNALTLTIYGIVLSIFAVGGGFFGGWLDDTFGSKRAILVSIGGTCVGLVLAISITPTELFFLPYDAASAEPMTLAVSRRLQPPPLAIRAPPCPSTTPAWLSALAACCAVYGGVTGAPAPLLSQLGTALVTGSRHSSPPAFPGQACPAACHNWQL